MLVALTGTPGTGKTSVAVLLKEKGLKVCFIDELADRGGALRDYDTQRESWGVDLERLTALIPSERPLMLVGHMSHLLSPELIIALRCHPYTLKERLEARGWRPSKVRENVEAESLDVIIQEALTTAETYEIDTTSASPHETVEAVLLILDGKGQAFRAGKADWSEVILNWY